ncbi:MAG: HEPN domain-containing protein [Anaerolineae bacterium]|nr:HEPN domain-containing protein [Anaerolineae bacterium]
MSPDDLDILSSYRVRVRYPGDDPTPDEAKQAMKIAQTIRRVIRRFLEL